MALAVFFGCTFIAFGPALGLFLLTVARDPLRIIILIAGAFFWLVSLLLSSLIWFIAVKSSDPRDAPLQKGLLIFGVMFSVLLQEAFRFLYYKLLRKAIEGLVALSEDGCSPLSIQQMAYVAGLGFGLMSGAFSMINLLADSLGPGTVGIHGDSQLYFLTSDLLQPTVREQPGPCLPADGRHGRLGLPAVRRLRSEPASLPAVPTEWDNPTAGILRPCSACPRATPLPWALGAWTSAVSSTRRLGIWAWRWHLGPLAWEQLGNVSARDWCDPASTAQPEHCLRAQPDPKPAVGQWCCLSLRDTLN
ncbi:gamma-secretase subunit Aph-1b isoform X1 [Alligator mississippiensis]|uniref:gamma-secretase subunit Aph-1b isoform X1 n=1 Tax=Alligator mississippiensis TaxID=8496 RepID=UPI002877F322|nr:gamma-secretase subunit Aph-1b isoform X1 [Alligator mississippiensis]